MEEWLSTLVIVHIAGGTLSLISGIVPMIVAKGSNIHRLFGILFFIGMCAVFVTGFSVSIIKQLDFLMLISLFSFYLVVSGYRSLYHKKLHWANTATWLDWSITIIFGLVMLSMLAWGVFQIIRTHGKVGAGIVSVIFGLIGLRGVIINLVRFSIPPQRKTIWIEGHISGMVGGYIAAFTAFVVVNNDTLIGLPPLLAWLFPTFLGVPVIVYWTRQYKKPKRS